MLNNKRGFTIVELLVVAPIVLLTIGAFITVIVNMTGDVLASRASNVLIYNIQDALSRIEDDIKLSSTFLAENNVTLSSPQGYDNVTTKFENVDTTKGNMLILNMLATTGNPLVATSGLIYLPNLPNACTSTEITQNTPMTYNVVYFVKSSTLYRRTILQSDYATAGCSIPWQQPSCLPGVSGSFCKTQDIKLVSGISTSDFTVQYFASAASTAANTTASDTSICTPTTDPTCVSTRNSALQSLATAGVSINVNTTASGRNISQSGSIRATRLDINASTIAPPVVVTSPVAPTPSVSLSSPNQAVFTWPTVAQATGYTFQYQLNGTGGAWTTAFSNQNTTTYTVTASHKDVVYGRVSATNSQGTSSYSSAVSVTIPLWATPLLQNNWTDHSTSYAGAGYTKTNDGMVMLKGLIKRSGAVISGETILTLPVGYRPTYVMSFQATTNSNAGSTVNINPDGTVIASTGVDQGWVSLSNMRFLPSTSAYSWTNLTPISGWSNRNNTDDPPLSYTLDGAGRINMRGALSPGTNTDGTPIANLPANAQSSQYYHIEVRSGGGGVNYVGISTANTLAAKAQSTGTALFTNLTYFPASQAGWTGFSALSNSWVNFGGSYATAAYRKDADNIVTVKGLIKSGTTTAGTTVATLPSGYRPAERLILNGACNGTFCRLDILPTGAIQGSNLNSGWSSLDAISFYADGN